MGLEQEEFEIGDPLKIRIAFEAHQPVTNPVFNIVMHILNGHQVTGIRTDYDDVQLGTLVGPGIIDIDIPQLNLLPNIYTFDAVAFHNDGYTFYDRVNKINHLKIKGGLDINGTAYLPHNWSLQDQQAKIPEQTR